MRCREQLGKNVDTLRVSITHLTHPVYGRPELAVALAENPAEYLPIVSRGQLFTLAFRTI